MRIRNILSIALLAIFSLALSASADAQCNGPTCSYGAAPVDSFAAPASFDSFNNYQANFDSYVSTGVSAAPLLPQNSFPSSGIVNAAPAFPNYALSAPIVGGPIGSSTPVAAPMASFPYGNAAPYISAPISSAPVYNAPIAQQPTSFPSQTFTSSAFGSFDSFSNFATPQCLSLIHI